MDIELLDLVPQQAEILFFLSGKQWYSVNHFRAFDLVSRPASVSDTSTTRSSLCTSQSFDQTILFHAL